MKQHSCNHFCFQSMKTFTPDVQWNCVNGFRLLTPYGRALGDFLASRGQCTLLLNGSVTNEMIKGIHARLQRQVPFKIRQSTCLSQSVTTERPTQYFFPWTSCRQLCHMQKHSSCRLHHNVRGKAAYLELEKQLRTLLTKPNQSPAGWYWTDSQLKKKKKSWPHIGLKAWQGNVRVFQEVTGDFLVFSAIYSGCCPKKNSQGSK